MTDLLTVALTIVWVWLVSVQLDQRERGKREQRRLEQWRATQEEHERRRRQQEFRASLSRRRA